MLNILPGTDLHIHEGEFIAKVSRNLYISIGDAPLFLLGIPTGSMASDAHLEGCTMLSSYCFRSEQNANAPSSSSL